MRKMSGCREGAFTERLLERRTLLPGAPRCRVYALFVSPHVFLLSDRICGWFI